MPLLNSSAWPCRGPAQQYLLTFFLYPLLARPAPPCPLLQYRLCNSNRRTSNSTSTSSSSRRGNTCITQRRILTSPWCTRGRVPSPPTCRKCPKCVEVHLWPSMYPRLTDNVSRVYWLALFTIHPFNRNEQTLTHEHQLVYDKNDDLYPSILWLKQTSIFLQCFTWPQGRFWTRHSSQSAFT